MLAAASAYAGEAIAATRTVQAFNGEESARSRYGSAVEAAYRAARAATKARSVLDRLCHHHDLRKRRRRASGSVRGRPGGLVSAGTLGQFLLYFRFRGSSLGALSEVWGELSQAQGPPERLNELLSEVPGSGRPSIRPQCPSLPRVRWSSTVSTSPIRPAGL